ncbi:MbnP family protein [Deinococcus radiophilus]|uniref:MbnP family protein n=1 Tax=Deinococcus radiophilus TaxID=32062 RepID=UPI0036240E81
MSTGLRFDVGVPRELNHLDATTAKAPLSIEEGMYWAWNSGYIFFSLHGDVGGTKVANHIGGDNHRVTVNLADLQKPGTALTVGTDGLNVPLNLDLQKLYAAGTGGEAWDFSKPQYQQVHFGAVADQFFANAAGAFSRAPAPEAVAAPAPSALPQVATPSTQPMMRH